MDRACGGQGDSSDSTECCPRVWSREGLLAFVGAALLAMLLWPAAWFEGQSIWSTDKVLALEPWQSEADLQGTYPHNAELGDQDVYIFPQLAFVQRHLHEHGELPLWNTGIYGGVPIDGNPQVALLYPFHLALLLFQSRDGPFSPWRLSLGLTWLGILRFVLCAVFAFLWLRRVGAGRFAAMCGAAFVAAGPYASLWRLHTPEQVFSLVPIAMYFVEGLLRQRGARSLVGLALTLGVSHLGGYPQTSMLFCAFVIVYVWLRAERGARSRPLFQVIIAGVFSGLMALPSLWPFLTYLAESGVGHLRAAMPLKPRPMSWAVVIGCGLAAWAALAYALRWSRARSKEPDAADKQVVLIGLVVAAAFWLAYLGGGDGQGLHLLFAEVTGHPVRELPYAALPGVLKPFIEVNQDHLGVLLVLLALAAPGLGGMRGLLVVVLIVGSAFPLLYQAVRVGMPLLEPSRVACLVPLIGGFLLAMSIESLASMATDERRARLARAARGIWGFALPGLVVTGFLAKHFFLGWPDAVALLVLALCAFGLAVPRWGVRLLGVLAAAFAIWPAYRFQPALTEAEVYPETKTIRFLKREAAKDPDLRVFCVDPGVFDGNALLVHGIPQTLGIDGMDPYNYLYLVLSLNYPGQVPPRRDAWTTSMFRLERPPFDLLSSRLVVARKGWVPPAHFKIVHETPTLVVAENPRAAPRVYVTGKVSTNILDVLERPPEDHVILTGGGVVASASPMQQGSARVVSRSLHEKVVATEIDGDGWLVVLDGHLRGWHATVDEQPAKHHAAFGAFRAVPVPSGVHEVRFVYRPTGFVAGWKIALASLIVLIAFVFLRRARVASRDHHSSSAPGGADDAE